MPAQQTTDKLLYRTPNLHGQSPGLLVVESTRHGGVSPAPYASLNLGNSPADAPENVAENRARFWQSLGVSAGQVATSHQVHGAEVLMVTQAGHFEGYDALITRQRGIVLAVTIADCTPVLLYDTRQQAVAAIHAGWRGTVQEIVFKTLQKMQQEFGTDPADCFAYIGTCIDECSFEVGDEVAGQFSPAHKWFNERAGKYYVDLKKANRDQLLRAGLTTDRIELSPFSTVLDNQDFFSYRLAGGHTGRMLACIGVL